MCAALSALTSDSSRVARSDPCEDRELSVSQHHGLGVARQRSITANNLSSSNGSTFSRAVPMTCSVRRANGRYINDEETLRSAALHSPPVVSQISGSFTKTVAGVDSPAVQGSNQVAGTPKRPGFRGEVLGWGSASRVWSVAGRMVGLVAG